MVQKTIDLAYQFEKFLRILFDRRLGAKCDPFLFVLNTVIRDGGIFGEK